ncbi:PIG-L family deacetylase [Candidatus Parcubacteria bacterium]|nr:MAG: PIG-L family deacetylase [Candidatus Parcubacteria bacterium]
MDTGFNFQYHPKALALVAHPDDEVIWMGGTILRYSQWRWTIFSLSRASDKDRAPKFRRVCRFLGAKPKIADWDDERDLSLDYLVKTAKNIIAKGLNRQKFDLIFTHGINGEYGHSRHRALHQAVRQMLKEEKLKTKQIFFFHYRKQFYHRIFSPMLPKKHPDITIKLTPQEFKRKCEIMVKIYGFSSQGPDVGYCTSEEAFKEL